MMQCDIMHLMYGVRSAILEYMKTYTLTDNITMITYRFTNLDDAMAAYADLSRYTDAILRNVLTRQILAYNESQRK